MRVAAVTGRSGSGKTTLLTQLIRRYVQEGFRIAAIKHTHHPLNEERKGDTAALGAAGAEPVIFARDGEAVVFRRDGTSRIDYGSPADLLAHVDDADIVLVEGFKHLDAWPRIDLERDARPTADEAAAILDRIWLSHRLHGRGGVKAKYRHVFFDVDSTLVTIEGIDILAGGNAEIAKLTEAAMNGLVPLDQVYARRLAMIRPTRDAVDALASRYLESIVDGAEETISTLHEAGAQVHLVTAGIERAVRPLAEKLGVRSVHAVRLEFEEDGSYRDFDRRSPLTRPHGKELVVRDIRARSHGNAAFIGDAVSDLEAASAVELFIGFGGVTVREVVKENAGVYVTSLRDIVPYLIEC